MSDTIAIVGGSPKPSWIKVSYIGVYDYDKVYRGIVNWFKSKGYFFQEKLHQEIVQPIGKTHRIDFSGTKDVSDYVRHAITIEIWTLRTNSLKGEKSLVSGEIQMRFKGELILDYKNSWDRYGAMGKVMKTFYHRYVIKKRIWVKHAGDVYVETNNLIKTIKHNLGLVTP